MPMNNEKDARHLLDKMQKIRRMMWRIANDVMSLGNIAEEEAEFVTRDTMKKVLSTLIREGKRLQGRENAAEAYLRLCEAEKEGDKPPQNPPTLQRNLV